MNNKICPKCGTANPFDMSFCTNCGQSLSASGSSGAAQGNADEPPPTVFINPTPTPVTNPIQPNIPPVIPSIPPQPPKKGGKGWLFALVGCLGLLILSGIGLAAAIFLGMNSNLVTTADNSYTTSTPSRNTSNNENAENRNSDSTNVKRNSTDDSDSGAFLVSILEARKQIGEFNQTSAESVETEKYFPEGTGAAQGSYTNGSKVVFLTVGQFDSQADAKRNFNDQISGVKSNGGKVTYQNTASDGTITAIYESRGYYFAEYCNTNNFCNRIHSDDRQALKSFIDSYAE